MKKINFTFKKLHSLIYGKSSRIFIRTFFARSIATLGALLLVLSIGRLYGVEAVGVFALSQGLLLGASIISRLGMDSVLVRYVGRDNGSPNVLRYFYWASARSIALSVVISVLLWLSRDKLEIAFNADGLGDMLIGISFAIPAYTFGYLLAGFFKGVHMPATACLLENGMVALLVAVFILLWRNYDEINHLEVIGYSYCLASWTVGLIGLYQLRRWCGLQKWWGKKNKISIYGEFFLKEKGEESSQRSEFTTASRVFLVANMAGFMQSVLSVMVAAWLLDSPELGLFKAAQQVALVVSFSLIVVNAIYPPRFAALYYQDKIDELGRLSRQGALIGTLVSLPFFLVCLVFPEWVLSWFGAEFSNGGYLLRIISFAQMINVATGSVAFILNMTGRERLMRDVAVTCNFFGLILFGVLVYFFGLLGSALGLAFILISQNLILLYLVWRELGIFTFPGAGVLYYLFGKRMIGREKT